MSEEAARRAFDAKARARFVAVGLASAATYEGPDGGAAVPCTVLVDNDVGSLGEISPASARTRIVTLFLEEVAAPRGGGRVTVGNRTYVLVQLKLDDGSRSQWSARNG